MMSGENPETPRKNMKRLRESSTGETPISKEQLEGDCCNETDSNGVEMMTYENCKCKFEKTNMIIIDPFVYLRVMKTSDGIVRLSQFKREEFRDFYRAWFYLEKNKEGELEKKLFIETWMRDPNKRVVSSIVVDPKGVQTDVYNMWQGYLAD